MNTVQVKVPELSESVSEATLLEWKRKPGDIVAADEILIEIETDKVVLEVPSPAAGQLAEIRAQNGQTVVSGEVIAVIDTDASVSASASTDSSRAPSPAPVEETIAEPRVMPSAAAVLAAAGIDAKTVIGTGPGNRITKVDALAAAEPPVQSQTAEPAPRAVPTPRSAAAPAPAEPIAARSIRPQGGSSSDDASAPPCGRAFGSEPCRFRAAHHLQRSGHERGHRAACPIQGKVRRDATAQVGFHVVL